MTEFQIPDKPEFDENVLTSAEANARIPVKVEMSGFVTRAKDGSTEPLDFHGAEKKTTVAFLPRWLYNKLFRK